MAVGRKCDQIRTQQRQASRGFGERRVVADIHADVDVARLVNFERPVSVSNVLIDTQEGQMSLAVTSDDSARPGQDCGIENAIAVLLKHSENGKGIQLGTKRRDSFGHWPRDRLCKWSSFFEALEAVPRHRALGKNDEPRSVADGFPESIFDGLKISIDLAKRDIHLNGCDLHVSCFLRRHSRN